MTAPVKALLAVPVVAVLLVPAGCGGSSSAACQATTLTVQPVGAASPGQPPVVHGKLATQGGAGVAGATVTVSLDRSGNPVDSVTTTTDSSGAIALDVAAAGPRAMLAAQNADSVALSYAGTADYCASGTVGQFSLSGLTAVPSG